MKTIKMMLVLMSLGMSAGAFAAPSFDDVMAASRQASLVCDAQGEQALACIVAGHHLQDVQAQYQRAEDDAEMDRMQHAGDSPAPLTAEEKLRQTDAQYLDAYARAQP